MAENDKQERLSETIERKLGAFVYSLKPGRGEDAAVHIGPNGRNILLRIEDTFERKVVAESINAVSGEKGFGPIAKEQQTGSGDYVVVSGRLGQNRPLPAEEVRRLLLPAFHAIRSNMENRKAEALETFAQAIEEGTGRTITYNIDKHNFYILPIENEHGPDSAKLLRYIQATPTAEHHDVLADIAVPQVKLQILFNENDDSLNAIVLEAKRGHFSALMDALEKFAAHAETIRALLDERMPLAAAEEHALLSAALDERTVIMPERSSAPTMIEEGDITVIGGEERVKRR